MSAYDLAVKQEKKIELNLGGQVLGNKERQWLAKFEEGYDEPRDLSSQNADRALAKLSNETKPGTQFNNAGPHARKGRGEASGLDGLTGCESDNSNTNISANDTINIHRDGPSPTKTQLIKNASTKAQAAREKAKKSKIKPTIGNCRKEAGSSQVVGDADGNKFVPEQEKESVNFKGHAEHGHEDPSRGVEVGEEW